MAELGLMDNSKLTKKWSLPLKSFNNNNIPLPETKTFDRTLEHSNELLQKQELQDALHETQKKLEEALKENERMAEEIKTLQEEIHVTIFDKTLKTIKRFALDFGKEITNTILENTLNAEREEREKSKLKTRCLYIDYLEECKKHGIQSSKRMNPWEFIQVFYKKELLLGILYQNSLRKLDPNLMSRFTSWAYRQGNKPSYYLNTVSDKNFKKAGAISDTEIRNMRRKMEILYIARKSQPQSRAA